MALALKKGILQLEARGRGSVRPCSPRAAVGKAIKRPASTTIRRARDKSVIPREAYLVGSSAGAKECLHGTHESVGLSA
jgi:hypothetical protein